MNGHTGPPRISFQSIRDLKNPVLGTEVASREQWEPDGFTSLASTTLTSVKDYLKTSYRPDCELVEGRVEERNGREHDHAALQAAPIIWFGQHQREWNIQVLPEQRIQISPSRFRVPDLCLVSLEQPVEQILTRPPLACIEIPCPEDTLRKMQERISDYQQFGVENVWILDPATKRGYDGRPEGWLDAKEFAVSNTPIHVVLPDIFSRMRPS